MDSRASCEPFGQQSSDHRCHCDHYCDCFPGTGCLLARCAAVRSTRDLHSPTAAATKSQLQTLNCLRFAHRAMQVNMPGIVQLHFECSKTSEPCKGGLS